MNHLTDLKRYTISCETTGDWIVTDPDRVDPETGLPTVIRRASSKAEAVFGLGS